MDRDPSPLYNVARSLMDIQAVFGPIPKIVGKGYCAQVSLGQLTVPVLTGVHLISTVYSASGFIIM